MTTNPYMPQKAKIISIKPQTDIDYTFVLESNISPVSGQFVEVSLPKVGECPISVSDFGDGWFELTIRRVGKVTNVLHELKAGDTMFVRGPYGNGFSIDSYRGKEVIVAAGGTGLAPVKSLLNQHQKFSSLTLLAGFKSPADILFQPELKEWQQTFNVTVTVDRGDAGWSGNVGLITEYVKSLKLTDPKKTAAIVVGPPIMMKFTIKEFLGLGLPEENITVSFERKMCCGLGKCGHCKIDDTYICLEGPVFNYTRAQNLID